MIKLKENQPVLSLRGGIVSLIFAFMQFLIFSKIYMVFFMTRTIFVLSRGLEAGQQCLGPYFITGGIAQRGIS